MSEPRKFHLSLNVENIDRSVEFYRKALGVEPAKRHADYAKFELTDPPLVLSLEPGRAQGQERLNHLGIRVPHADGLRAFAETAHASGLDPQYLQGVECCYSRQTKLCLTDPDKNLVEFYIVEADLEKPPEARPAPASTEPAPAGKQVAWDHLLGTPFPNPIALGDASADEVRLRGTFNVKRDTKESLALLGEAKRVLKPGGELMVHLLVSDRKVTKKLPRLPGPAALVEHTPTESEALHLLEEAGFRGILIKRLSHSAVFEFDGAQMRELMLTASVKAADTTTSERHVVVYKGPAKELTDDYGVKYVRGERTVIGHEAFLALNTPQHSDSFVFLNTAPPAACAATRSDQAVSPREESCSARP